MIRLSVIVCVGWEPYTDTPLWLPDFYAFLLSTVQRYLAAHYPFVCVLPPQGCALPLYLYFSIPDEQFVNFYIDSLPLFLLHLLDQASLKLNQLLCPGTYSIRCEENSITFI